MPRWEEDAKCRTEEHLLFFSRYTHAQAKALCYTCPVIEICRWYAIANEYAGVRYGIFGGMSPDEREDLSRRGITQDLARFYYDEDSRDYEARMGCDVDERGNDVR